MPLFMLDTNICSAAMKGDAQVDARLRELDPADVCISAITRAEIQFGIAKRPEATKLASLAARFLDYVRAEPWDATAADRHGELRAYLRLVGRPIGDFDEMIAAHAFSLEAVLVTNNERHFAEVPGLRIENWLKNH